MRVTLQKAMVYAKCTVSYMPPPPTTHAYHPSLLTYPIPSQVISLSCECRTMGPLCGSITNRCQMFFLLTMGHVMILYSLTNCMFYRPLFYYLPSRYIQLRCFPILFQRQLTYCVTWTMNPNVTCDLMTPSPPHPPTPTPTHTHSKQDKYTHGETNERFLLLLTGLFCCSFVLYHSCFIRRRSTFL